MPQNLLHTFTAGILWGISLLEEQLMKTITVHDNKNHPIYDIVFSKDYSSLKETLISRNLIFEGRRVCIVSESNVAPLYLNDVSEIFSGCGAQVTSYIFEAGEKHKNLQTVQKLYEHLILSKFDRKDLLVALGGGVTGDLTGFGAATYLRGIDFIQLPTSLLSQVDSSTGGKTGVDFNAYKNMVGAFHQPKLVYINLGALKTLKEREYLSGMGEIIKHGLIKDSSYYEWLKSNADKILDRDLDTLETMVFESCQIKRRVVENDPEEKGERALLNFGHTLGHAIEKLSDFKMLHGECVSAGACAAAYISFRRGLIQKSDYEDICNTFRQFKLPTVLHEKNIFADNIVNATKLDKKMENGQIKFILLSPSGHAVIDKTVSDKELFEAAISLMPHTI